MEIPLFGPGTRVEVSLEGLTLVCRTARMQGRLLYLATPPGSAALASLFTAGRKAQLTLYRAGACWEAAACLRQWIWGQPALLAVGPVQDWSEVCRRRGVREGRAKDACLALEDGAHCFGRTRDLSQSGVSLLVPGGESLQVGMAAQMTLQVSEEEWRDGIALRIRRLERWLSAGAGAVVVGASIDTQADPAGQERWESCLARLREREDEEEQAA